MGREVEKEPVATLRLRVCVSVKVRACRKEVVGAGDAKACTDRSGSARTWGRRSKRCTAVVIQKWGPAHSWRGAAPGEGPPGECSHSRQVRLRHCSVR